MLFGPLESDQLKILFSSSDMNKIASIDAALTRCIQDMQMSLSILAISMQTMTYDEMQWWRAMRELWPRVKRVATRPISGGMIAVSRFSCLPLLLLAIASALNDTKMHDVS
jgi:hypothetical protein